MIIREYRCRDCGSTFESTSTAPDCPGCASLAATREFRTPVGIATERSRGIDTTLQTLADDYGMSNLSNRDGEAVANAPTSPFASRWLSENEGRSYMNSSSGDALSPVKGAFRALPVSDSMTVLSQLNAVKP